MKFRSTSILVAIACGLLFNKVAAQTHRPDAVVVPASTRYSNISFLGRIISGSNYRKEWTMPVAMPVFRLKKSGFTIEELGGGMQTKSLKLLDTDKREWVLRSVDKQAEGALPKGLRNALVVNFVQDQISASYPYAAIVVDHLARAADIIAPKPKLYFVPDDEAFGAYRKFFANTVCFLEQRAPTPDNSETENTEKVMEEIIEENDHLVLQQRVLQARLLDMLVGDWDRHADQWRWGAVNAGGAKYYYAIPRDRDQAFFWTNGLLPRFIKIFGFRHVNGFKKKSRGLKNLNYKSWQFDKTFLNELDGEMWEQTVKSFENKLTEDVITNAVKKLPSEIYAISGKNLEERLISRRNTLFRNAMKYYKFISGTVTVYGTEEKEIFEIKGKDDLNVCVYRAGKDGKPAGKIYERVFRSGDTGYIYLDGYGGDDKFFIDKKVSSKIKIRIRGGKGNDLYELRGDVNTKVYDSVAENNKINHPSKAKFFFN